MKIKTRIWLLPIGSAVVFGLAIAMLVLQSAQTSADIRSLGDVNSPQMELTTQLDRHLENLVGSTHGSAKLLQAFLHSAYGLVGVALLGAQHDLGCR